MERIFIFQDICWENVQRFNVFYVKIENVHWITNAHLCNEIK